MDEITVIFADKKKRYFYVYHCQYKKVWRERMKKLNPERYEAKFFAGEKQKENAQSYINYIENNGYNEITKKSNGC